MLAAVSENTHVPSPPRPPLAMCLDAILIDRCVQNLRPLAGLLLSELRPTNLC